MTTQSLWKKYLRTLKDEDYKAFLASERNDNPTHAALLDKIREQNYLKQQQASCLSDTCLSQVSHNPR